MLKVGVQTNPTHHRGFLRYYILEQSLSHSQFVAGRLCCIVICINPAPTQMIDGTEKPIRSLQMPSVIQ